jgi:hypothetical protein
MNQNIIHNLPFSYENNDVIFSWITESDLLKLILPTSDPKNNYIHHLKCLEVYVGDNAKTALCVPGLYELANAIYKSNDQKGYINGTKIVNILGSDAFRTGTFNDFVDDITDRPSFLPATFSVPKYYRVKIGIIANFSNQTNPKSYMA